MNWSSLKVRETFIQFFLNHSKFPHVLVPSSQIVPKNDPSLPFINAGMNQFKDIILGHNRPLYPRVVNSQKCLRINDLSLVGKDTFHHTFFEMLGNWSFSNYFKKEACEMSWTLLTNDYKLDPNRLYVTYFAGNEFVPVDLETKNIWESIGVPNERILPFQKENFWQMGVLGPCGPSTEIHYDHRGTKIEPSYVNKDFGSVVEIWNLVFMQYNRLEDGKLERLPLSVVDTGAGLERLTAVLNQKESNYDTDLFLPIFNQVKELTGVDSYSGDFQNHDLDTAYRVFADHMRAITVALSDQVLPQTNSRIRKLLNRCFSLTRYHFMPKIDSESQLSEFLQEIVSSISSTLDKTYPEMGKMKEEINTILSVEVRKYLESIKTREISNNKNKIPSSLLLNYPNLLPVTPEDVREVRSGGKLSLDMALKWYKSHGLTEDILEDFCTELSISFDSEEFSRNIANLKSAQRKELAKRVVIGEPGQDNNFIKNVEGFLKSYDPNEGGGVYEPGVGEFLPFYDSDTEVSPEKVVPLTIECVFNENGTALPRVEGGGGGDNSSNSSIWAIFDKTPFIPGNKHFISDNGVGRLEDGSTFKVTEVREIPSGWFIHKIEDLSPSSFLSPGTKIKQISVDNEIRFGRSNTFKTFQILKQWFKERFGVVRFSQEYLSHDEIQFEVTILNGEYGIEDKNIQISEEKLNYYGFPIVVTKRLSKINGVYRVHCVTLIKAHLALENSGIVEKGISQLKLLENNQNENESESEESLKLKLKLKLKESLKSCLKDESILLTFQTRSSAEDCLIELDKKLEKTNIKQDIEKFIVEIKESLEVEPSPPFILKAFKSDQQFTSLKKISRVAEAEMKPVLVVVYSSDGSLQARCAIPKTMANEDFQAVDWLNSLVQEFSGEDSTASASAPKGQDPKYFANIKRVDIANIEEKLKFGLEKCSEYIEKRIQIRDPSLKNTELESDRSKMKINENA